MNATLEFFGTLRPLAGTSSLAVTLDAGSSAGDAIRTAAAQVPALSDHLVRDGALDATLLVSIADRQILDPDAHALSDGDTITVMAPISGG